MDILYALEKIRTPFWNGVMSAVTQLGGEVIFIVAAVVVFWCVSKWEGYYLMTIAFCGTVLNQFLKLICRVPRPWVRDPNFTIVESARAEATGYSFPSGHTQNAIGLFGGMARWGGRRWVRLGLTALALVIAFSRMYLGVHTPADVGVSLVLAAALVLGLYPLMRRAQEKPRYMGYVLAAMLVVSGAFVVFVEAYGFSADTDAENLASGIGNAWKMLGAVAGMTLAWLLDRRYIHFETQAVWWVQVIKVVVGMALLLAIKSGLKAPLLALLGHEGLAGGVRYFLLVLVAGAVWPLAFRPMSKWGKRKK
ncbi:phosphatase PAP2 family protein [Vescimonas sp.]|uniref:phosphatase PAP2 family protein n=1 Tax=Vescimonas sp. TaxID=2892404 RepID=UPI00307877C8